MSDSYRIIDSVLHPTDFSQSSLIAFHHALKAALVAKAQFTLLHVATGDEGEPMGFPAVRETLERWGLLPEGSRRDAVLQLGINVRKVVATQRDPVDAVLHYMDSHPTDIIVLAAHQHEGRSAWMSKSVSKPIARLSGQMTLFIPENNPGFVSAENGALSLKNILIPVAETPEPQPAVEAAARLAVRLECATGTFTLLHIGEAGAMPVVELPEVPGWQWKKVTRPGAVIQGIVDAAHETDADLVVMSTDGRNGFLDAFRGTHSEQVLRDVSAPLLTVPAGSIVQARLEAVAR